MKQLFKRISEKFPGLFSRFWPGRVYRVMNPNTMLPVKYLKCPESAICWLKTDRSDEPERALLSQECLHVGVAQWRKQELG